MSDHKLLEDALEEAYRDHMRKIINVAIEGYMVGGVTGDDPKKIVGKMRGALAMLSEIHRMISVELKNS